MWSTRAFGQHFQLPPGVVPRTFRPGDEQRYYDAYTDCFRDSWEGITMSYGEWARRLLESPGFDPELWVLLLDAKEVAGFAICHAHQSAAGLGWVRMLGVRPAWRGRGLGRALLLWAFAAFADRGFARVGLGVDAESETGARQLYQGAGMDTLARFDVYEKALA